MAPINILCILFAVLSYSVSSAQNMLSCNAVIEYNDSNAVEKLTFFEKTDQVLRHVIYYDFTPILKGNAPGENNLSQIIRYEQQPLSGKPSYNVVPRENNRNYLFKQTKDSLRIYSDNRYPLILYVGPGTKNSSVPSNQSYPDYELRYPEDEAVLNFRYSGSEERGASFTTYIPSVEKVSYVLPDITAGDNVAILLVGIFRGCMCGSIAVYFGDLYGMNNDKIYIGHEKMEYYRLFYHTFSEKDNGRINISLGGAMHDMSSTVYSILVFKAGKEGQVATEQENKIHRFCRMPADHSENSLHPVNLRGQVVDRNVFHTLILKPPLQYGGSRVQTLPENVAR